MTHFPSEIDKDTNKRARREDLRASRSAGREVEINTNLKISSGNAKVKDCQAEDPSSATSDGMGGLLARRFLRVQAPKKRHTITGSFQRGRARGGCRCAVPYVLSAHIQLRHNLWLTGTSKPQSLSLLFAHSSPLPLQPHRCLPEWPYRKVPSPDFLRKPSGVRLVPNARRNGKPVHQQTVWAVGAYAMHSVIFFPARSLCAMGPYVSFRAFGGAEKKAVCGVLAARSDTSHFTLRPCQGKKHFFGQRLQRADLDDLAP